MTSAAPGGTPPPVGRGLGRFFAAHPIVALAILTPGIPEYLSTSSPVLALALNPVGFFLQLAINVGQYTAGALLVREAMVRWGKGWASVVLLGAAYAVVEEGLGDSTIFNSTHGADGVLGSFGRFAGVNWVWTTGILAFHILYSIGLPILLLGLAVPSSRGRSLLGRPGLLLCVGTVALATLIENRIVYATYGFWAGAPLLVAALAAIAGLVVAARLVPPDLGRPRAGPARLGPWTAGLLGFAIFPVLFALEYDVSAAGVAAPVVLLLEAVFLGGVAEAVRRGVGRPAREYLLVQLAGGLLLWQSLFGVLLTLGLPYTLPLVGLVVVFLVRLRRAYAPAAAPPTGAKGSSAG